MVYGPASLYPTSSIDYALPLSIRSAEDYSDVATPTGEENEFVWDNNSAVFYFYDDSKYVSWRESSDPLKDLLFTGNHDTNAWNVYRMTSEHDLSDELQALIDEYTSEGLDHASDGTNPGCYQEDVAKEYNDIFEESKRFVGEQHTEEEFNAQSEKLRTIHDKLSSAFIPITEGYYTIVNRVVLSSSPIVAAYANSSAMQLYFAPYDSNDSKFVFYVTKAEEDNEYYIEHFLSGTYVGDMKTWYNSYTEMTQNKAVPQHITLGSEGWFWGSHQFHTTSKNPFAPSTPFVFNNHEGPLITWGNMDDAYSHHLTSVRDKKHVKKLGSSNYFS